MLDLDHIFTHHPPTEAQLASYHAIRRAGHAFAKVLIENTPKSADQAAAIRKVREAVFTANAAIALNGRLDIPRET